MRVKEIADAYRAGTTTLDEMVATLRAEHVPRNPVPYPDDPEPVDHSVVNSVDLAWYLTDDEYAAYTGEESDG